MIVVNRRLVGDLKVGFESCRQILLFFVVDVVVVVSFGTPFDTCALVLVFVAAGCALFRGARNSLPALRYLSHFFGQAVDA